MGVGHQKDQPTLRDWNRGPARGPERAENTESEFNPTVSVLITIPVEWNPGKNRGDGQGTWQVSLPVSQTSRVTGPLLELPVQTFLKAGEEMVPGPDHPRFPESGVGAGARDSSSRRKE